MDTGHLVRDDPAIDPDAERWQALLTRDPEADGHFVYSVKTTGIYCRPSCSARRARRENVAFHANFEAAEAAGFRPCKRCRPKEVDEVSRQVAAVTRVCRMIEAAETPPPLVALAGVAGMSTSHFHRTFRHITGVTPKAYGDQHRAERVAAALRDAPTITGAFYEGGFNASSRFYESATARLGMTPGAYRAGGAGMQVTFAVSPCSLGTILVAATARGLCAILLGDDPDALVRDLRDRFPRAAFIDGDSAFEATVATVVAFVESPRDHLDLPLDIVGTAFQQRVWAALQTVPLGRTATYAEIAHAIGQPRAVRAVATACGANKIAVAIPCHRIIHSDGSMSGYRWGVARKRALLAREGAAPDPIKDGPTMSTPPESAEIAIVSVEPRLIAMVRSTVPLSDIPRAQRDARALLQASLQAAAIQTKDRTLTVWRPPQDGKMDYAPGVFVPEGFQASGAVSLFTLPAGRAAHLRLRGSFAGLPQAWGQLFAGLAKIGAAPAGLNWEVYGASDLSPEETETDLYALLA